MKSKKFLGIVLALAMIFSLGIFAACGNNVPATDISISSSSVELVVTGSKATSAQLTATVEPGDSTDEITWTVDAQGSGVISLSANKGATVTVTAVSAGTATITAAAGEQTATCTVNVSPADVTVDTAAELLAAVADTANGSIFVENGTYNLASQVYIGRNLTIIGESEEGVILQPESEDGFTAGTSHGKTSIITVTNGADVNISNLTVKNGKTASMGNGGSDTAHGINIAQAGTVVVSNVTASDNNGVGVLVNDSVVTLNNVTTSGNGWGGVNIDVVGRNWAVPSMVLTVDENCSFAEQLQIYCDEEAEYTTLSGKVKVPETFNQEAIAMTMPFVNNEGALTRYIWTADAQFNTASKIVVATPTNISKAIAEMQDGAILYMTAGTYDISVIEIQAADVSIIGVGDSGEYTTVVNGVIQLGRNYDLEALNGSAYNISGICFEDTAANTSKHQAVSLDSDCAADNLTINVSDCTINGYAFGIQIGTSATNSQVNVSGVDFVDVWCAVSIGGTAADADDTNTYTVSDDCTFTQDKSEGNDIYKLQDFRGYKENSENNVYYTVDDESVSAADAGSMGAETWHNIIFA